MPGRFRLVLGFRIVKLAAAETAPIAFAELVEVSRLTITALGQLKKQSTNYTN